MLTLLQYGDLVSPGSAERTKYRMLQQRMRETYRICTFCNASKIVLLGTFTLALIERIGCRASFRRHSMI